MKTCQDGLPRYSVEPLERFAVLPVHPWSAPCVVPGFKRARAAPERRNASLSKIRKGLARLRRGESQTQPNQHFFVCASIALKARLTRLLFFSWVNRNLRFWPETAVNRFAGVDLIPEIFRLFHPNIFGLPCDYFFTPIRHAQSRL